MSLLLQNHPLDENKNYELKKINDSMSEKIKQNQKQKAPSVNQNGSNISSGLNTEKRYNKNYSNEEINSGIFNRNGSQSSLSIDLNRFKINPNNFNNISKSKENKPRLSNNNNMNINLEDNFETFNPRKDQLISINNSKGNIYINNNNENLENSNILNNTKNKNKKEERKNAQTLLKDFNPYDIRYFLGENNSTSKKPKNKLNLINNISPSISNLQMVLYNKKIENMKNQKNPDFLFNKFYQKESRRMIVEYLKVIYLSNNNNLSLNNIFSKEKINQIVLLKPEINEKENTSLNNSINNNNLENSIITTNKKNDPFSINNSQKSHNLMELSSKNIFNEPNSFRMLNTFLNDMDDESKDKISLITFLSIPRIMKLVISKEQKFSFVFYSSPTNISCLYGIETYIFKWNDCQSFNLVGYFDLINVENCYLDNENKKLFYIDLNNNNYNINKKLLDSELTNDNNHYSIEAEDEETGVNYVQAINFISQLIKYRVYLNYKS